MRTLCALLGLCVVSALSRAEPGITVTATGEAQAQPDSLEIILRPAGSAELTGDAIVKFRDSVRRTLTAFENLKLENLKVETRELTVGPAGAGGRAAMMAQMAGNDAGNAKVDMEIARRLTVKLDAISSLKEEQLLDAVAKIFDTAKDCGATPVSESSQNAMVQAMFGQSSPGSILSFVVSDPKPVRHEATRAAMNEARAHAAQLAELAGGRLGAVVSVAEIATPTSGGNMQQAMLSAMYGVSDSATAPKRVSSETFGPITVQVTLRVGFALEEMKP